MSTPIPIMTHDMGVSYSVLIFLTAPSALDLNAPNASPNAIFKLPVKLIKAQRPPTIMAPTPRNLILEVQICPPSASAESDGSPPFMAI